MSSNNIYYPKNFIIYKFTNKINDKVYIGKTINEKSRKKCHKYNSKYLNTAFYNAVRKYGWENFDYSIIFNCFDIHDLNYFEKYFIKLYNSCTLDSNNNGYNMTRGGDGIDSDFTKNRNLQLISNNTHHWQNTDFQKNLQNNLLLENKHCSQTKFNVRIVINMNG